MPRAQPGGFQEYPANTLEQEPASGSRECSVPPPYATPVMPLSRWLRSVGVFWPPAPCWVPQERWLGSLLRPSLVHGGPAPGAWHGARCWCQAWTEEPRMNGNQKLDPYAQEKQNFIQHFSQIVKVLTEDGTGHPEIGDAIARLKEVLEYNAVGGKYQRGLTVLIAYRQLVEPGKQDADSLRRALTVGWCVELLQAFFLVSDDIMDSSLTRRGQVCWYQKPGIGLDAINDALLLEACIYRVLRLYCREQPYYLNLIELFLQSSYQTELGQTLDLITAPQGNVDLSRFTEKRYKSIVKYKTAFYSFYLPVAAAMYMAGIDGEKEHASARKILLEMGEFFQVQDDYLDLFGDPSVTGKIGTDIQDNKCSWLVVQCLQRASPEQRKVLQENYGQKEAEKVARVKALYEELELPAVFGQYQEDSYGRLMGLIEQHSAPLPPAIFLGLAHKIYKRKK
ncbi:farnesyl pyrophosphate synthase isoform X2 [Prionailurus viverrinus]|uniref:farnesyl pyrophosphate synthase isoform X2 n=1 Tax=Prionailurus viverrinus TaxID=61388 RepID=UPI001FF4A5F1|nr:farnesyl pyrophosphate synthase isoform X2 [Prionailurus viverrinus]